MNPTAILSFGALLMAAIITWYLVQALRQAQRTALAMEELLNSTRPNIEATSAHLRSLLTRVDAIVGRVEESGTGLGGLIGIAAQAVAGWKAGAGGPQSTLSQLLTMISAIAVSIQQTWSIIAGRKTTPDKERSEP